jgi:PAS domain S-box-containing protein
VAPEEAHGASDRSQAELRRRSEAVLRAAVDAVISMDHTGVITDANEAAESMFGRPRTALVGQPLADAIVPPQLRESHRAGLRRYVETETPRVLGQRLELSAMRASGEEFPVEVSIVRIDLPGPPQFTGFIRDITDRKLAEEAIHELNADLERRVADRTAELATSVQELDAFAHSVAHDLRAPLRAMDGFSRVVEEHGQDLPDEARDGLARIRAAAQRMGVLIDGLLDLSELTRQDLRKRHVEPATLVREALADVLPTTEERPLEISVGDLPACEADPILLKQVFVNLIDNGLKFTREQAHPRIEVGSTRDEDDRVVYFVRDNGVGFDMAYADLVFGTFERLHEQDGYEGTGIGLATVRRIIQRHGGRIWAESAPMQGATFSFVLEGEPS